MTGPLIPVFALKFLLELVGWAGTGVLGFQLAPRTPLGWVLAFAIPLAVIGLWSLFIAPRATRRLPLVPLVAAQLLVFVAGAVGLWMLGWQLFAFIFIAVAVVVEIVLVATKSYEIRP